MSPTLTLPTARVGTSPLPPLRSTADLHTSAAYATEGPGAIEPEMATNLAYGRVASVLPYLPRDVYDRTLADVAHHVVALADAEDLPAHGDAVKARFPSVTG